MNDLDLCLEVVSSHGNHCVTFDVEYLGKPLEIETWFQRTTNWKWYTGYRMVT